MVPAVAHGAIHPCFGPGSNLTMPLITGPRRIESVQNRQLYFKDMAIYSVYRTPPYAGYIMKYSI